MSRIEKLSILGVRSFDNIRSETIQFHTPLTLIVGYNGSGKTTIIECLKYATTGQLPPNSKGGAFIHDPKLCGEKEVLAQVKLSFKSTTGAKMVVTRSLQLTVKKTTRSQKTLEGQLLMVKDGERTTISARVAELDTLLPQYLGVSEAILDSVIFCHQDESLWPMSDPGTLKKKFDEIFEALKYTKAIENIRAVSKAQKTELGKITILEAGFKTDKDRGERAEKKSLALQEEIEKLRGETVEIDQNMQIARDGAKEKHKQSLSFHNIINELEAKRTRAREREETVSDLRTRIEEREESDAWLKSTLAQYAEQMAAYKEEEEKYTASYRGYKEELVEVQKLLNSKLAEQGQYKAQKEQYERQIDDRIVLVKEAARRHSIRGYDGDLDEAQIRDFVERVSKLSREKSRELERVRKTTRDELAGTQAVLSELQGRRAARIQDKVTGKQAINGNDKWILGLQHKLDAISIDEGAKAVLDTSNKELQERLQKAHASFEQGSWDRQLQMENAKLRSMEEENTRLNEELVQSTRQSKERAQLDFTKKELKNRERSRDTMIATYGDKISELIGPNWQASTLEREFQAVLDQQTRAVGEAQRQRDGVSRELEQVNFKLSTAKESRRKKIEERSACEKAVVSAISDATDPLGIDDYLVEIDTLEKGRDTLKFDIENFKYTHEFYTKCLAVAEQKNQCHLCDRKFSGSQEQTPAITKLKQRINANARESLNLELVAFEEQLKEAQAVRSKYETYKRLSDVELPALERDIEKAEDQHQNLVRRVEEHDGSVSQEESTRRDIDSLKQSVNRIIQYNKEINEFDATVSRISTQQMSSGGSLSLDEIQEQLSVCVEQTRNLRTKITKMSSDKDHARALINTLELELSDAKNKLSKAEHQMETKQGFLTRIHELNENNSTHRESIQRADLDLEALVPQMEKAQTVHDDAAQHGQDKENEIHEDVSRLSDTVNKLAVADRGISAYIDNGGPTNLKACERAVKSYQDDITRLDSDISKVTAKANKVKEQVDNSDRTRRSIEDNIVFRKNLRALEILHTEIAELETRNATEDYNRLDIEVQKLNNRYQILLAERGSIAGAMKAKDDELRRLLAEWETDYKDAARKYREAHIKVETTKAAIEDLGRYGNALDQAIMKYHSIKMEEINRIAGELWQSTYQGTDVDTILIRSDSENTAGRKNYNYRVCMVKQDAEMDMRGRCSAGQRVLASIIIRLALAECFGVNCGLIALDEPTTNLDSDNIRSLAKSLHDIIKTRQAQSNFQLIVITHDEEFLRFMQCADFCDNYYRVSRDDKQKSVIERQSIAEVMN